MMDTNKELEKLKRVERFIKNSLYGVSQPIMGETIYHLIENKIKTKNITFDQAYQEVRSLPTDIILGVQRNLLKEQCKNFDSAKKKYKVELSTMYGIECNTENKSNKEI